MRKPKVKRFIKLTSEERQKLKKLRKRVFISIKAKRQIDVFLMLDNGGTITVTAEVNAVSHQTIKKWRVEFAKNRLESLIYYEEKRKEEEKKNRDKSSSKKVVDAKETEKIVEEEE